MIHEKWQDDSNQKNIFENLKPPAKVLSEKPLLIAAAITP
jgi:hypothetical protein